MNELLRPRSAAPVSAPTLVMSRCHRHSPRSTEQDLVWVGGRESICPDRESQRKTRLLELTQTSPAIYVLPSFAIVFLHSPLFSNFAGAMSLKMSLAASAFRAVA